MWKRLLSLSLTFGLAGAAPPALAQVACGSHAEMAEHLKSAYDERVIGRGLQSSTRLFEVWRSLESGSWTILMIRPDGMACHLASGFSWVDVGQQHDPVKSLAPTELDTLHDWLFYGRLE